MGDIFVVARIVDEIFHEKCLRVGQKPFYKKSGVHKVGGSDPPSLIFGVF